MNIAFYESDPKDPVAMREFMDLNAIAHTQIHDALLDNGIVTPKYCLSYDEITRDFLRLNNEEITAWAVSLGIDPPVGIEDIDPDNPGQMEDWMNVQQLYVGQVATVLNL